MSLKSAITLNTRKIQIVAGLLASILVTAAAAEQPQRVFCASLSNASRGRPSRPAWPSRAT
jgi:hypothetical protein